jgi:hypothetical protein
MPRNSFSSELGISLKARLLLLLGAVSILGGCGTLRDFSDEARSRNIASGHAWISDQMFPATISVAGSWTSSGWKNIVLSQTDRTVKGHLDDYAVDGVVSGSKAYLLASRDGWYRYSLVLEMPSPNILLGYYSRSIPYESRNRQDLRLDRAGQ